MGAGIWDMIGQRGKPGLWGFFTLLYISQNKNEIFVKIYETYVGASDTKIFVKMSIFTH